ncbi:hypothetical protein IH970_02985 [candidate division KSB1 bacterium]|nr:hypothetical protein [candidate division KSB1 bacterium]
MKRNALRLESSSQIASSIGLANIKRVRLRVQKGRVLGQVFKRPWFQLPETIHKLFSSTST